MDGNWGYGIAVVGFGLFNVAKNRGMEVRNERGMREATLDEEHDDDAVVRRSFFSRRRRDEEKVEQVISW